MKNIHVLATDKPSRLVLDDTTQNLILINKGEALWGNQHIYITDDSEIKDVRLHKGKWQLEKGQILNKFPTYLTDLSECKLVVMTTDPDLIADGVQAIDDELLKWFVKNPNCEQVEVITEDVEQPRPLYPNGNHKGERIWMKQYKIILPQEEPKCFYDKPSSCENSECRVLNKCNGEFISSKQETGKEFYESADKVITVNREEEPKQYPIAGYAPGNYMCYCSTCDIKFQGDKRAVQCEPCAIKTVDEANKELKTVWH